MNLAQENSKYLQLETGKLFRARSLVVLIIITRTSHFRAALLCDGEINRYYATKGVAGYGGVRISFEPF